MWRRCFATIGIKTEPPLGRRGMPLIKTCPFRPMHTPQIAQIGDSAEAFMT